MFLKYSIANTKFMLAIMKILPYNGPLVLRLEYKRWQQAS